jgi:hypothetical protein
MRWIFSSVSRRSSGRLYVIESPTFTGTWVYTKGTILVSAKLSL